MPETSLIPKSSPKDVFMHFLAIVTLYGSVISLIALLFQCINVLFPDPLNYYYASILQSLRWSASVLVVMFPVYVLMSWLIKRDFKQDPAKREVRVRKWLIYLTLFFSAITVIVDVITLVYNLLGGEFTIRFLLKILVVLITAGAVFLYYFFDLRQAVSSKQTKILAWVVSVIVAASMVAAFVLIGSPQHQRLVNFDERKVSDLQMIQNQTINYWQQKGSLPTGLANLTDSISGFTAPKDPQTSQDYEYLIQSNLSFQLCANFNLPSTVGNKAVPMIYPPPDNWNHGAGQVCFDRTIDPQLYKLTAPPIK